MKFFLIARFVRVFLDGRLKSRRDWLKSQTCAANSPFKSARENTTGYSWLHCAPHCISDHVCDLRFRATWSHYPYNLPTTNHPFRLSIWIVSTQTCRVVKRLSTRDMARSYLLSSRSRFNVISVCRSSRVRGIIHEQLNSVIRWDFCREKNCPSRICVAICMPGDIDPIISSRARLMPTWSFLAFEKAFPVALLIEYRVAYRSYFLRVIRIRV